MTRRMLLATSAAAPLAGRALAAVPSIAMDEAYWADIAAQYDVTREVVQLENGNWGMMARPVLAAYQQAVARVNRDSSYYARRGMGKDLMAVQARVAQALGVTPQDVVLTRNATEALKGLITGYNRLRPGDAILYADLDYDSMQASMDWLKGRRGVDVVTIALPEPATHQSLIDAYAAAFDAHPKVRLVLLTHLSHRTGLVIPVREIVELARARGIDAIVDAAHSWGQLDFALPDIAADFVGVNLHKWMGAPLGVGAMVIRKERIADIDADPGEEGGRADSIQSRAHTGTPDYAAQLTVPVALDFQQAIGAGPRAARLRHLRDRWAEALRGMDGLEILTPADPRLSGAITSFRLRGLTSADDNRLVAKALLDEHRIFTVHRTGVAKGACVRVTPALFTSPADVDALVVALKRLVPKLAKPV
ncbi:aminotransferase class V-fold PLP-dependent enzyme [Sphingobium aquiterrae]|uniref:aminotransferase class V-fold PLP-dependent enzyme n=1 Tax=Sphingobium aquiterrae TaxID=2038656 RepID=UPI003AFB5C42